MFGFFKKSPEVPESDQLYLQIVRQARQPVFYQDFEVPDTPDGRFDMLVIHAWLVFRRLRAGGDDAAALSQGMFDLMFDDMDRNLREMGVGDLAVGKRIKGMAQGFYGRVTAYDQALEADHLSDLCDALRRNVYRTTDPAAESVESLAHYVRRANASLDDQSIDSIVAGEVAFEPPIPSDQATGG